MDLYIFLLKIKIEKTIIISFLINIQKANQVNQPSLKLNKTDF